MEYGQKKQADIVYKGIHTFQKDMNERGDRAKALWVVEWVVDGTKKYRNLEKREFWKDQNGEWKLGKSKGLNLKDMILLTSDENFTTLMRALGSSLPEHSKALSENLEPKKPDIPDDQNQPDEF